jgi:hypothetical protein
MADLNTEPDILTPEQVEARHQAEKDSVGFLIAKVTVDNTTKCLDSEDQPCFRLSKDPTRRLHRLYGKDEKPSLRVRSYLRGLFHYLTRFHLSNADLFLVVDYMAEDAFQGGRERLPAVVKKEGDYNFESLLVFANTLTVENAKQAGQGNMLLDQIRKQVDNPKPSQCCRARRRIRR